MARGSKAAYSSKQRRQARHIEESYEERSVSPKTAAGRAWATVNKLTGGAQKARAKSPSKHRRPVKHRAAKKAAWLGYSD